MGTRSNTQFQPPTKYAPSTAKRIFHVLFKFSGLLIILLLATSHENQNPKVGESHIDFYIHDLQVEIEKKLSSSVPLSNTPEYGEYILVEQFYAARHYTPAWTLNFTCTPEYEKLDSLFQRANNFGLESEYYKHASLDSLRTQMQNTDQLQSQLDFRAELEVQATYSALRFIKHLSVGIALEDTSRKYQEHLEFLPDYLNATLTSNDFLNNFLALQPKNELYNRLLQGLQNYLHSNQIDSLQWSHSEGKGSLESRLVYHGFLNADSIHSKSGLETAIKQFQKRHGLKQNGKLTRRTIKHLEKSSAYRYDQIALNLNRIRRQNIKEVEYMLVNIPEYKLSINSEEKTTYSCKVVVGRKYTPTPEINGHIHTIVTNPYWTVPKSITFNEIIPKVQKDSTYLERNNFFVIDNYERPVDMSSIKWSEVNRSNFNYWIRQKNTYNNALGKVKFIFPNKRRIFLHDTPSKQYFNKDIRAYSHGCIRVENPDQLAQFLIENYHENKEIDINQLINSKKHVEIHLEEQLPIFLQYITCTTNDSGQVVFLTDIYNKDLEDMQELKKASLLM